MSKLNEQNKVRLWLMIIVIIAIFLGVFNFPKQVDRGIDKINEKWGTTFSHVYDMPFHLGLDLQGGTHLVYEADVTGIAEDERGDSVGGVRDVIERRVNSLGVAEPIVQVNQSKGKWRVIVELAGVLNVNEAIQMIGETPLLEFKEKNEEPPRALSADEKKQLTEHNDQALTLAKQVLKEAMDGQDFISLVEEYSQDEYSKYLQGSLGYINAVDYEYLSLYTELQKKSPKSGELVNNLVETDDGYYIVNVEDERLGEKQVKASHLLICYEGAMYCENKLSKQEAWEEISKIRQEVNADNFAQLTRDYSTEPGVDQTGGDLGWFGKGQMVPDFEKAVFELADNEISEIVETDFGYHLILKQEEKYDPEYKVSVVFVNTLTETDILPPQDPWKNTGLSGKHLKRSMVEFDSNSNLPQVSLEFNDEGKELFADITTRNIGKQVAIFLDGQVISSPVVQTAIKDGRAVITGNFNIAEAKLLTQRLNAGALPVPINLVSQQTVGASLGAESLQKSLFAGFIGLLLVIVFMILYYRLPGFVAVISLSIYTLIILFVFKLIPITLTLSGIAGVILSLGMAVDANVLIFERLKEELKSGKPLSSAIDEGFRRAWPSIRDGNASTLITCFVLAFFGTSLIKGFAITLGIGVFFSMLSAILITRVFLKLFSNIKKNNQAVLFAVKEDFSENNK